jgi:RNase P protein component
MLPKKARLTSAEVREVLKKGRSINVGSVSARYTSSTGSKAAVVVSSAVAPKAATRNALRRLGYSALARLPKGLHMVVFVRSATFDPKDISSLCSKLS